MKNKLTFGSAVYGDDIIMGGIDYAIDINGGTELTVGVAACGTLRFSVIAANPFKIGDTFTWSRRQIEDEDYTDIGVFTVSRVQKQKQKYTIETVDGMAKFDIQVDSWLNGLSYPTTHAALLNGLCGYVGVTLSSTSDLTNGDRSVPSSPAWEGATGRDILGFLAEASGCFACMLPNDELYVGWYSQTDVALTKANYTGPFVSDYTVAAIDKVQVRSSQNDIGVIAGDGENAYIIENNPLFYAESDADLRPYVERLLSKLSALTYTPCEVPMYNDRGLRPGDIFTIDGAQSIAMALRCTASGSIISSTGSETRPTQSTAQNRNMIALMGKTNELTRTVEETKSELKDAEGNISTLTQTAASLETRITNAEGDVSTLRQTVDGFETRIENSEGDITTLSATVDGLSTQVSDNTGNISTLEQTVDGLSTRVSNTEGDVSTLEQTASSLSTRVTNAEGDISTLEQTASSISARVGDNEVAISNLGVQLTGYVTFTNLTTAGQTIINGDNITTGTIKAITLDGCVFTSTNSLGYVMKLDGGALLFQSGSITVAEFGVYDGRAVLGAYNGFALTFEDNPQIASGSSYYENIHAGNIGSYISNVYAVFG